MSRVVSWVNWLLGSCGGVFMCCWGLFIGCCGGLGIWGSGGNCCILGVEYFCGCVGGFGKLEFCFERGGFVMWEGWFWSWVFWCGGCCRVCWSWSCWDGFGWRLCGCWGGWDVYMEFWFVVWRWKLEILIWDWFCWFCCCC